MWEEAYFSESNKYPGKRKLWLPGFLMTVFSCLALAEVRADMAQVLDAKAEVRSNGLYAFSVTLVHADEGWTHYASEWRIIGEDGKIPGVRTLFHPHENNVPFTRSLTSMKIPHGTRKVTIVATCSRDGVNPEGFELELPPR